MAVPPMIGVPESGAYILYSGSPELFAERRDALATRRAPGMSAKTLVRPLCTMWRC